MTPIPAALISVKFAIPHRIANVTANRVNIRRTRPPSNVFCRRNAVSSRIPSSAERPNCMAHITAPTRIRSLNGQDGRAKSPSSPSNVSRRQTLLKVGKV